MLTQLNEAQLEAVTAPYAPVLVLAGAGAGKTRVVTHRIKHLINQGMAPNKILAVTFTNKAAKELKERVAQQCSIHNSSDLPMVCTFHGLGVFILKKSLHLLGRDSFIIYDQDDSEKVINHCLQKLNLSKNHGDFRAKISHIKNNLQSLNEIKNVNLLNVYREYQTQLEQANALDFDDLLLFTVKLLTEVPEAREEYSHLWQALLIDEYQDTNHAQYKIAQALSYKHKNIFVVGDPDQSIYSWRGANIQNILNFEEDFPKAKIIRLEENYRSCSNILNAANALITHNTKRLEKILKSVKGPGSKIQVFIGETERREADFVAMEIFRLKQKNANLSLRDICIFYRTNFQSRTFEKALTQLRIPYEIIGGLSFYRRKEVQDILAFLRLMVFPFDGIAFERTLKLITSGIGATTLMKIKLFTLEKRLPWVQACREILTNHQVKLSTKQQTELNKYIQKFDLLFSAYHSQTLYEFITSAIHIIEYLAFLQKDPDFESRKDNLNELIADIEEWSIQFPQGSLEDFLNEISLKSALDEADNSDDRVNLMTIHNGKGLEFRVAFIVGMEEKLFPHASNLDENIEEERRLCYVGITRAQELLYLTAARMRSLWKDAQYNQASRFLKEIPREYIQMRC